MIRWYPSRKDWKLRSVKEEGACSCVKVAVCYQCHFRVEALLVYKARGCAQCSCTTLNPVRQKHCFNEVLCEALVEWHAEEPQDHLLDWECPSWAICGIPTWGASGTRGFAATAQALQVVLCMSHGIQVCRARIPGGPTRCMRTVAKVYSVWQAGLQLLVWLSVSFTVLLLVFSRLSVGLPTCPVLIPACRPTAAFGPAAASASKELKMQTAGK